MTTVFFTRGNIHSWTLNSFLLPVYPLSLSLLLCLSISHQSLRTMKFMKLGTRPDTFFSTSDSTRSVSSEIVATDVIIQVEETNFLLHKFPLVSKCSYLKRILRNPPVPETPSTEHTVVKLSDQFPGGASTFEICAKFCYGVTITISPINIVAVRSAAEYLQMSDDVDKGNLAGKLDSFLHSCILQRWKDSLVVLQSTRKLPESSDEVGITGACLKAISTTILSDQSNPKSGKWWGDTISELGIDHFEKIMNIVSSAGKFPFNVIGDVIMTYTRRWLHKTLESSSSSSSSSFRDDMIKKHREVLEKIIRLMPPERDSVPVSFLLRLLKVANRFNSTMATKTDLTRMAGIQLEEAEVMDLLIPSVPETTEIVYDVDLVMMMLEEFLLTLNPNRLVGDEDIEVGKSIMKVANIIDSYLREIAKEANLPMNKFVAFAEVIPNSARPNHDDLYHAVAIFLKEHPNLEKSDRKKLCRVLDCKKLSMEACMHAAQNEMLPLRVVVQVLFFEQARAAVSGFPTKQLPDSIKAIMAGNDAAAGMSEEGDEWSISKVEFQKPNLKTTLKMKIEEDEEEDEVGTGGNGFMRRSSSARFKALCAIPTKHKRMITRLWSLD